MDVDDALVGGHRDGVVEEVQQDALDQVRVAAQDRLALATAVQRHALRLGHEPCLGEHGLAEHGPGDVLQAER